MKIITKEEIQKRVLKAGNPLDLNLFKWNEETRTFSSKENGLVLDFSDLNNCHFNTGSGCYFNTRQGCTFFAGSDCIFVTGSSCYFNTGFNCTFITGVGCEFNTSYNCTFKTSNSCTFNTSYGCTFKTGLGCTFNTGADCTFDTGSYCYFITSSGCTFNTSYNCTFFTGLIGSSCVAIRRDIFEVILLERNTKTIICPYGIKGYLEEVNNKLTYSEDSNKENEYIIEDDILSKVISRKG